MFLISMLTHLKGLVRGAVPGSLVCFLLGVVALNVVLSGHQGRTGRVAYALAATGLALGVIGMLGSWLGVVPPNPLAPIINGGEHVGLILVGAGLVGWGLVAIRTRVLGLLSLAPIVVGLLSLIGVVIVVPGAFTAVENSAFPKIYALAWMLLGIALVTSPSPRRQEASRIS